MLCFGYYPSVESLLLQMFPFQGPGIILYMAKKNKKNKTNKKQSVTKLPIRVLQTFDKHQITDI